LFAQAPAQNRINGMGTGILIDPRGYIVTNHHVVEEVNVLRVRLAEGTTVSAKVIARDPENDLALLKIDVNKPLPVMPVGTAQDLLVGETVIAVGNAYGYDHTVTVGIISAIKRDVTLNKEVSYKSLIQTDAAINPGNSGGPLINIRGELIGVNVAIRAGAQGIGFAIPVDTMLRVAADMLRRKSQLYTGVTGRDHVTSPDLAPATRELVLEKVDGPAAKAGLRVGDVVKTVREQPVVSQLDWERIFLDLVVGERVGLVVQRAGQDVAIELMPEA